MRVSVIISTYNRPQMLKQAIQSVLNQTFRDFEVIVVDDGLKERAEEVVKSFDDTRIRYIAHEQSRGCAATRVTGIKNSKGDFVAYLDDDDVWEPNKLEVQFNALNSSESDVGFSFTAVTQEFDTHTAVSNVPDGKADYFERALRNFSGFLSVTLMFKREVFEKVGVPDPSFPSHTDIEFILRVAQKYKGLGINRPLTRVNSKSDHAHMGRDFTNRIRGREMLLDKHKEEFRKRPDVLAKHIFKLGWFYRSDGRYREARRVYLRALKTDFHMRYLINYLSMTANGLAYRLFVRFKKALNL